MVEIRWSLQAAEEFEEIFNYLEKNSPQYARLFAFKVTETVQKLKNFPKLGRLVPEIEKSEMGDVLKLIEGSTTESLDKLQEEIDFFLKEEENEKKPKPKDTSNPFLALIGYYNKTEKKEKSEIKKDSEDKPLRLDDWIENTHIRPFAAEEAKTTIFDLFDIYKKAHQMPSYT